MRIGWHGEAFARTKSVKSLAEYLKPEPTAAEKREAGARQLIAMLERKAAHAAKENTVGLE